MKIKKIHIALLACMLVMLCGFVTCSTTFLSAKNTINTQAVTRTIEVSQNSIDYESIVAMFDETSMSVENGISSFEGIKTINLYDFVELELIGDSTVEETADLKMQYNYTYDYESNYIVLSANLINENGDKIIDKMIGVPFVNDNGELDAVFDCDGEYILLSELQDTGMIENCGWFKNLFKKVSTAIKKVTSTTIGVVGAVATIAVPAVIGVVCSVVAAPVVATVAVGAIVGAGIAAGTAAISTYQQDGKIDWEAVGICTGVGGAIGAVTAGVAYGITKVIIAKGKVSKDIDMDKISEHVFSKDHVNKGIMELGSSKDDILTKFFDTARSTSSKWIEGSNEIRTIINGKETTIRIFVKNGEIINLDGFIGTSSRAIGNLINLIK